jgi:hypothetical protein
MAMVTTGSAEQIIREESRRYQEFRCQARRYLEAVYGKDVWFRAPETFENLVERWIWTVSTGMTSPGNEIMTEIEVKLREAKERNG